MVVFYLDVLKFIFAATTFVTTTFNSIGQGNTYGGKLSATIEMIYTKAHCRQGVNTN